MKKYSNITAENVKKTSGTPQVVQANPLDKLDFDSEDFKAGVSKLAQLLKVPEHPNHLVTLKAVSLVVKSKLTGEAMVQEKSPSTRKAYITIEDVELGFDTGDKVLNRAAKILSLLHINDMRLLQTEINRLIVEAQSITANPKTDTTLGKVGR